MALTYTNIASTTLGSGQTSVTFSSIPQTYTDLVLKISARVTSTTGDAGSELYVYPNNASANFSLSGARAFGTTISALRLSNSANAYRTLISSNDVTANTFSNTDIYITNYTASSNKPASFYSALENNSSTVNFLWFSANLWRDTSAITSLVIGLGSGIQFTSGSTFYLYGIKNA